MRFLSILALLALVVLGVVSSAFAQAPRTDVIWARQMPTGQHLTLDGVLDEPAWASAESINLKWSLDTGIPGSGYKPEAGTFPNDPTNAVVRLLVDGDYLYLGATVPDASIGGAGDINRVDGFLMMIMDHISVNRPTPPLEHFYSWWYDTCPTCDPDPSAPGKPITFVGAWAERPPGSPRTLTEIANWNAVTVVNGTVNDDTGPPDVGYTVEMRFNLVADGYTPSAALGDIVEWSIQVYDADWNWPINNVTFAANRTWFQNPWGNTSWYSEAKVYTRPSVTTTSGPVPAVGPDLRIPNAAAYAAPVIDGVLSEPVWQNAPHFDIRYGDDALRNSYPNVGKFRSGQYQPPVNAGLAYLFDPGDATVYYFFKGDWLYLGFDFRDIACQYFVLEDRWDGFDITILEKTARGPDHELQERRLACQLGPDGHALAQYYLPNLRDVLGGAQVQMQLKPGSTLDTLGQDVDNGYQAELAIDLTKLGYPSGLGDGTLFLGIDILDGDSFTPFTDSYATRTWWFIERAGNNGPAWCYLDPTLQVTDVQGGPNPNLPLKFALLGNYPNPFRMGTSIRYALPQASNVTLEVYDLQGRRVQSRVLGVQAAGEQRAVIRASELGNGLYVYRLTFTHPSTGAPLSALSGKMMLIQ